MQNKALRIISITIIVLGLIGACTTIASFDYDTYKYLKEESSGYSSLHKEEYEAMSLELTNTWVYAIAILVTSLVIGVTLLTLDYIADTLNSIDSKLEHHAEEKDSRSEQGEQFNGM